MKIRKADMSESLEVVCDEWGCIRQHNGKPYIYMPLPICRVPIGHNQDERQAYAIARKIISALDNLDSLLAAELPTLEEIEGWTCHVCSRHYHGDTCPNCGDGEQQAIDRERAEG